MAKILFSHSYYLKFDPKQWKTMKPYPPLGTLYAASVLREEGHQVSLFDTMFVDSPLEIEPQLDGVDYLVIYDDSFNWLTKMCLTNMRHACWEMAKLAKQKGVKVIVSSSDSTDHTKDYLKNGADYVIVGEGEITLSELIQVIEIQGDEGVVSGVSFLKDNCLIQPSKRPVIKDLDELPIPAWDLVDIELYRSKWKEAHGYFSLNMVTTRGCPYKCNWCAKPIFGRRYTARSVDSVVDELAKYVNEFKVDHVWFCDDIFGLKPGWVGDFDTQLKAKKVRIKYMIQSRVDLIMKGETARELGSSGCQIVWLGAESGSQKILDAMDKETELEDIYSAREALRNAHVKCAFFLQFGYLGEEKEDILATIRMVEDLMPDEIGVSVSYPLPGTKFYEKVKDDLKGKSNWTDSDDLDLMFSNKYSKSFYRYLQRYIHKDLQLKKGIQSFRQADFSDVTRIIKLPYYWWSEKRLKRKLEKEW